MTIDCTQYRELMEAMKKEVRLLPAPQLYEVDDEAVWAAMMDRVAQLLENDREFSHSNDKPLSAIEQLTEVQVHLLHLLYGSP